MDAPSEEPVPADDGRYALGLVVVRSPGVLGLGLVGLIASGVMAILGGLAWPFVTGAGDRAGPTGD